MTTATTVFVTVGNNSTNNTFIDSEFRYTVFPIFYGLVFTLGLIANCYTLYVLHHMRESKAMNEIRIYMTNLTVADLLFVSALPFWIGYYVNHGDWKYPDALCRVIGLFFFINTYCSILFLTVISINRCWVVTRPLVAASSDCWKRGAIVSAFIWIFTLAAAVIYLTQPGIQKDNDIDRCFEGYQNEDDSGIYTVAVTHFIIIGLFFLVLIDGDCLQYFDCSSSSDATHQSASSQHRKASRWYQAQSFEDAVCCHRCLCDLFPAPPRGSGSLGVVCAALEEDWNMNTHQRLNDLHQITLMLMGLNCLLDPLVYCFATTKFRKYIENHFTKVKHNKNCSHNTLSPAMSLKSRHKSEI